MLDSLHCLHLQCHDTHKNQDTEMQLQLKDYVTSMAGIVEGVGRGGKERERKDESLITYNF